MPSPESTTASVADLCADATFVLNATFVLTLPEVAERLKCSESYVYVLHNREGLPVVRMGGRTVVRVVDLAEWLAARVEQGVA